MMDQIHLIKLLPDDLSLDEVLSIANKLQNIESKIKTNQIVDKISKISDSLIFEIEKILHLVKSSMLWEEAIMMYSSNVQKNKDEKNRGINRYIVLVTELQNDYQIDIKTEFTLTFYKKLNFLAKPFYESLSIENKFIASSINEISENINSEQKIKENIKMILEKLPLTPESDNKKVIELLNLIFRVDDRLVNIKNSRIDLFKDSELKEVFHEHHTDNPDDGFKYVDASVSFFKKLYLKLGNTLHNEKKDSDENKLK